jgi:uncharacterized protein YjbJ (UPF0337 family)
MVNQQTITGNWNEIKGKLKTKWGQLTNDDVQTFNGNVDQLIGLIQRKTGEARGSIEKFLEEATGSGAEGFAQASEKVREYAGQAAEQVQQTSKIAAEQMQKGYHEAERMVRERPGESVAVVFGAGLCLGVLFGLMVRR